MTLACSSCYLLLVTRVYTEWEGNDFVMCYLVLLSNLTQLNLVIDMQMS